MTYTLATEEAALLKWDELTADGVPFEMTDSDGAEVDNFDLEDRIDEVVNHRKLPGEGEFDIPGYVEVLKDMGYSGPWGVEVLSAELRSLPIEEEFNRAYETTLAQFSAGVA